MQQSGKFIKGALILSVAGMLAKFVSVFYKIPLNLLVGDSGIGYYQTIFPIFSILISAGFIGIPNALSKLMAEQIAIGRIDEAKQIFKDTFKMSVALGIAVSFLMVVFAKPLIKLIGWPEGIEYVIWGFAIAPVFVFITGAIKGYFQGFQVMLPTALSQIIENFTKVVIGISLVSVMVSSNMITAKAVGGAAFGTSIGFIVSAAALTGFYYKKRHIIESNAKTEYEFNFEEVSVFDSNKAYSFKRQLIKIVKLAIPVSISAAVFSIMSTADSLTLPSCFKLIGYSSKYANEIIGKMGNAYSVINFPLTISVALAISILPAISEAAALKNTKALVEKVKQGIKLAIMLALPAAAGLFILAEPIMKLLYPKSMGSFYYLQIYSICLIFIIIGQTLTGILQGVSKASVPLYALAGAIIVKVLLNYLLVPTALKGIGAGVSSIAYYATIMVINYIVIKRTISLKLDWMGMLIKPIVATIGMMFVVFISFPLIYNFMIKVIGKGLGNAVSTLITVSLGILMYIIILLYTKSFSREELSLLPKNKKIINFLEKRKLL